MSSNDCGEGSANTQIPLLTGTFVIAVCGLVYELLAGTISSYLLGDSVFQFSLVIGVFMAAMGIGAFLSRHIRGNLASTFVTIQVILGLLGGFSAALLFFAFSTLANYDAILLFVLISTGTLVGLEIPVIVRLLREEQTTLRVNLSNVLSLDYVGALVAALLFPLVLVPQLGLIRTSLLFGLLNVSVGILALYALRHLLPQRRLHIIATAAAAATLIASFIGAESIERFFETRLYTGTIVHAETTPYQRIVITTDGDVTNLFLNGGLQFSTIDEYRYHEALVHPAMTLAERHQQVLILGGGDGMALREVLRYRKVKSVTLVDLDPRITELFSHNTRLSALNDEAFADSRVKVINADAGKFIETRSAVFDVIIVDLPDPRDVNLSRLYTREFYTCLAKTLAAGGILVTQATSPFFAQEAFWSIIATLEAVPSPYQQAHTLSVLPYHAYVPTFGEWGFAAASPRTIDWSRAKVTVPTRYLDTQTLAQMPVFPPDIARIDVDINSMQTHQLTRYYELGWSRWYR